MTGQLSSVGASLQCLLSVLGHGRQWELLGTAVPGTEERGWQTRPAHPRGEGLEARERHLQTPAHSLLVLELMPQRQDTARDMQGCRATPEAVHMRAHACRAGAQHLGRALGRGRAAGRVCNCPRRLRQPQRDQALPATPLKTSGVTLPQGTVLAAAALGTCSETVGAEAGGHLLTEAHVEEHVCLSLQPPHNTARFHMSAPPCVLLTRPPLAPCSATQCRSEPWHWA